MMKSLLLCMAFLGIWGFAGHQMRRADRVQGVRGVWIAAPRHNTILHSREQLISQLETLQKLGINTIFLCAWAENQTVFKSQVLFKNSNYKKVEDGWMLAAYVPPGSSYDPVQTLIEQAHRRGIRVFFWFEYGFMAQWGSAPDLRTHPLLATHPDWAAVGHDGLPANYNGTDYYLNAFHPAVQQFLRALIAESLQRYPEVDGIQGDDRLPASPANSGYDPLTTRQYQKAFNGLAPPADYRDSQWFDWRIQQLNSFATQLRNLVKSFDKKYSLAFSPNPYPWCRENLMQDWPSWISDGNVDLLNVQCYRTSMDSYRATVSAAFELAKSKGLKSRQFSPGILLGVSDTRIQATNMLDSMLAYNAQAAYGGQSFFYVKWLTEDTSYRQTIRRYRGATR